MRKIISDFDGVWFSTELAKAARWYLAAMRLTDDPEVTEELIKSIATRDASFRARVKTLIDQRQDGRDFGVVRSFAGGTRKEVALRTAQYFHLDVENLLPLSECIREPLVEGLAEPLFDNLAFFREVTDVLKKTYWDEYPIGLVTQTESTAVYAQFQFTRDGGSSLWGESVNLQSLLGPYEVGRGFRYAECAGDYEHHFKNAREIRNPKTKAYQVLCAKLGVRPTETISFEDTEAGVVAAKTAGVTCIGLLLTGSNQDLSAADLVVEESLKILTAFADVFVWAEPAEAIAILRADLQRPGG